MSCAIYSHYGRRGGLIVCAPVSGASGLGSSPVRGPCVVLLGHPGVQMGTGEFNAGG